MLLMAAMCSSFLFELALVFTATAAQINLRRHRDSIDEMLEHVWNTKTGVGPVNMVCINL